METPRIPEAANNGNGSSSGGEVRLRGLPVSPGIAIGSVYLLVHETGPVERRALKPGEVDREKKRFLKAVETARREIRDLRKHVAAALGKEGAGIFEAHEMLLSDPAVVEATTRGIERDLLNADHVFSRIMQEHEKKLLNAESEIFQQRAADIRDVHRRVLRHLRGDRRNVLARLPKDAILVTHELTPSDTASLEKGQVLGFATDLGGKTSHAAIMARALGVPAVVGLHYVTAVVRPGDTIVVDGLHGEVVVRPSEKTLKEFQRRQKRYAALGTSLRKLRTLPARTLDGKDVELSANIELPDEIENLGRCGAHGIGLYRTEYLYLAKEKLPTEEELYQEFRRVVEAVAPYGVILRTLDVGGDKRPPSVEFPEENNPFLGLRGVRFCFERPDIFRTQLRAILRAGVHGPIKILLPMISSLTEVRRCRQFLREVDEELAREGVPHVSEIEVGAMIEVPAAALSTDLLARECDFLSIGTNDLVQYALAVDRGNEHIAHLYQPFAPAVLRLIKQTIDLGHRAGIWVGMCGEMAGDPLASLLLLGLGLDEFSVSPIVLPEIKHIIRSVRFEEAEQIARWALEMATAEEVEDFLHEVMTKRFPELVV